MHNNISADFWKGNKAQQVEIREKKGTRETLSPRQAVLWLDSGLTAVLWCRWSTLVLFMQNHVYRSATQGWQSDVSWRCLGRYCQVQQSCQPWLSHWKWAWWLHGWKNIASMQHSEATLKTVPIKTTVK